MDNKGLGNNLSNKKDIIVNDVMDCIFNEKYDKKVDDNYKFNSKRDLDFIIDYLSETVYFDNPGIFNEFSIWLNSLLKNLGLEENVTKITYQCIKERLNNYYKNNEYEYLVNIIEDSLEFALNTDVYENTYISNNNPHKDYANKYLELLLDSNKVEASKLIIEKALPNMEVNEIYLDIFQPVQKEVGRLWHINKVSVAQEHYISSVTQLIMSQLYSHFLTVGGKKGAIVTTAVGNELHEIGIRMVADLLEIDGYDTIHLGANTPQSAVIDALKLNKAKLLGISVTLPIHLKKLDKLVEAIRKDKELKNLKIVVGGYAFNHNTDIWKKFKVDAYSCNAKDAVLKVNELTGGIH
ncbi:MAG: cobalamin B12-binding domain-containing protein [Bacillota bacterium]